MCHLALPVVPERGDATTWLEAVTDEEYHAAHSTLAGHQASGGVVES